MAGLKKQRQAMGLSYLKSQCAISTAVPSVKLALPRR